MTVTSSRRDTEKLTYTIVAEFDAPVERVWQVWEDPRQLERWWGPPTWPATFPALDLRPGGGARYYMSGPDGERAWGWWSVIAVDAPARLEFDDGFGDDTGEPLPGGAAMRVVVTLEPVDGGRTRMTIENRFPDAERLEQLLEMGMEEGETSAVGQIDAILAA